MTDYSPAGYRPTPFLSDERQTRFSKAPELGEGIEPGKDYQAVFETSKGRIVMKLYPEQAPMTVNSFVYLIRHHYYDGIVFHRVIDGFMAQTGDVEHGKHDGASTNMAGMGGSDLPDLEAEFNDVSFQAGTVGMARAQDPNSANSQFFINFKDNHFLNGQYTVYGRVVSGMEHVDKIARGEPPANPDRMISVKVAADA